MLNVIPPTLILWLALSGLQSPVRVVFDRTPQGPLFRLTGWNDAARNADHWADVLNVYVDTGGDLADVPPLSGTRELQQGDLVFVPRYPLGQGLRFTVIAKIPGREEIRSTFETPKADRTPTTVVEHIYPSTAVLPENQLKFYIHFSAPMSRGEAYKRIKLIDESRGPVEMPFLELEQELWDAAGQRLTLFFDPGRIKRDVLPNEEMGPPIEAGHAYTLTIDKGWPDADGRPLKSAVQKHFSVAAADRQPLNVADWRVSAPARNASGPVIVDFPEPLDHALMLRQLEVIDSSGAPVEGAVESQRDEMRWSFSPKSPWKPGKYSIRIGTIIADLAGNMIDRPFEIDRFDTVTEHLSRETRDLEFTVP